jgi:hypothetical protein
MSEENEIEVVLKINGIDERSKASVCFETGFVDSIERSDLSVVDSSDACLFVNGHWFDLEVTDIGILLIDDDDIVSILELVQGQ